MTTDNDPLAAAKAELLELERELTQRLEEIETLGQPSEDGQRGRAPYIYGRVPTAPDG